MANFIKRTFIPGDTWIYFKLYTGYKTADAVLGKTLPVIISRLTAVLDKWFFIRYSDPKFHLRLRFCVKDIKDISAVISIVYQEITPYLDNDLIWKVQIDTYQRELERYGTNTIAHAEAIFHFDSEATMDILSTFGDEETGHERWLMALKILDALLCDFEFDIDQKIALLGKLSRDFKSEFGFNIKGYKLQLDKKYRANRKLIEEIMAGNEKGLTDVAMEGIIGQRSFKIKPVATALMQLEARQELEVPLYNLLSSYLHMMVNRLFRSKQRLYEMVIYDMLERHYSSVKARNKYHSAEVVRDMTGVM